VGRAEELFDFFVGMNIKYLQFIPCVEIDEETGKIVKYSIGAEQYGEFLCRFFDKWLQHGPEKISVRNFDSILSYCLGRGHTVCTFGRRCDDYVVVEHNGDVFCCDFFVEPDCRLGNILEEPIGQLASSERKQVFSKAKQEIRNKCLICRHLDICRGGCMKYRAYSDEATGAGEGYYLCQGYKMFFDHAMPKFMQLAATV